MTTCRPLAFTMWLKLRCTGGSCVDGVSSTVAVSSRMSVLETHLCPQTWRSRLFKSKIRGFSLRFPVQIPRNWTSEVSFCRILYCKELRFRFLWWHEGCLLVTNLIFQPSTVCRVLWNCRPAWLRTSDWSQHINTSASAINHGPVGYRRSNRAHLLSLTRSQKRSCQRNYQTQVWSTVS